MKKPYRALIEGVHCVGCEKSLEKYSHHIFHWENKDTKYGGLFCMHCGKHYEEFSPVVQRLVNENGKIEDMVAAIRNVA